MIGKITGTLDHKTADYALIDVQGIGYIVYCSERTLSALPVSGTPVALYTDLLVREDLLQLFGFATLAEKEWHKLLTSVQGVGAKASLAILGTLGPEGVGRAIALGDWGSVKAARGIGPKIAQRVVQELKDKAPQVMALAQMSAVAVVDSSGADAASAPASTPPVAPKPAPPDLQRASTQADALSALANLGYAPADAARAVAQAAGDDTDDDAASLIRAALKLLAPAT